MKIFLLSLFYFFSLVAFGQQGNNNSFYKPRPKTFIPVNDFATMFSQSEIDSLSKKITQYRDTSTNVIVIITQNSLKDGSTGELYQLEEAAKHYFNNWGIGLKDKNNGVLFFIVKNDHKIRIATGKGIENVLNDNDCQDIIDEIIVPNFKQANYYKGINESIDKVMQILSPEKYVATNEVPSSSSIPAPANQSYSYQPNTTDDSSSPVPFFSLILVIIILVFVIAKLFGNINSSSTVYNATEPYAQPFTRRRGIMWFLSGFFLSSFFNNRNSSNSNYNSSNNSDYNNNDSYTSSSSDSFSSSSDSGSSFGGGSSDGGGASGSW